MGAHGPRAAPSTTSLWLDQRRPGSDPFVVGERYDCVVAGAGLTGLTTALLLARAGVRVAVLEARRIGSVTTGHTTAKASVLQGTRLQRIRGANGTRAFAAHLASQLAAIEWLRAYAGGSGAAEPCDAVTYASSADEVATVRREYEVARAAGLPVQWRDRADLPTESHGAVVLSDQLRLHPIDLLDRLAADLRALGGVIIEGVRVIGATARAPVTVRTTLGAVQADSLVLATGVPVLDRGLYFAKVEALRSYVVAFDVDGDDARDRGMFLSAGSPARSVRWHDGTLLVGGGGHGVGRHEADQDPYGAIEEWTVERFPTARRSHAWSAQDYESGSHLPFVGPLPRGRGRVLLATGYAKWGMTGAVAAALTLAEDILARGRRTSWQRVLRHRITQPVAAGRTIAMNGRVLGWYAATWVAALAGRPTTPRGTATTGRLPPRVPAIIDGRSCELSLVCPHLGAVVRWNDVERSWDCPAHGSRFDERGHVLEGPATRGLGVREAR